MSISSFFYNVRQGIKNIFRNSMFSLASIATMTACIFLFAVFFAVIINVRSLVTSVEEEVGITVLFDEGIKDEKIKEIGDAIASREEVKEIKFTSAEEAWENFQKEYFKDHPEYAETFKKDNPLSSSASYTVRVRSVEEQAAVVEYIRGLEGVREVNQSADAIETLKSFNRMLTYVSIAIILVLLVISVFLIANTINIGISVRREEIGIMKLIGATDSFVRTPFIVEGAILGLVGAGIPLLILYFAYDWLMGKLLAKFGILSSISGSLPTMHQVFQYVMPVGLALGVGIGLIGSIITVRRHLDV
ncbi:MAG: permease-like cell division protein FtsX [Lachnospiraceae bacterium]|nr:permease-like cell division protein FtsX [Lachnospiraceae bacterium]